MNNTMKTLVYGNLEEGRRLVRYNNAHKLIGFMYETVKLVNGKPILHTHRYNRVLAEKIRMIKTVRK